MFNFISTMRLAAFVSTYNYPEILKKIKEKNKGLFLVEDGIYHATLKENKNPSEILSTEGKVFALIEDVHTRGFKQDDMDPRVTPVNFKDLVDLVMKEYEKLVWL